MPWILDCLSVQASKSIIVMSYSKLKEVMLLKANALQTDTIMDFVKDEKILALNVVVQVLPVKLCNAMFLFLLGLFLEWVQLIINGTSMLLLIVTISTAMMIIVSLDQRISVILLIANRRDFKIAFKSILMWNTRMILNCQIYFLHARFILTVLKLVYTRIIVLYPFRERRSLMIWWRVC